MNKRLLLIAGNYFPELTGIGRYNAEMIDWLADNGFNCTVISTYPYYPQWKVQLPYDKKNRWFRKEKKLTPGNHEITVYRCPHYIPADPTGKKRILFDFSFFVSVTIRLLLFAGKKYDYISTISPGMQKKISVKTGKQVFVFPNWTDTKNFFPMPDKAFLKQLFGFKTDMPIVLYSGAIGEKQGLEAILYVAQSFEDEKKPVQFVICGSGPYKSMLQKKAAELNLGNIS